VFDEACKDKGMRICLSFTPIYQSFFLGSSLDHNPQNNRVPEESSSSEIREANLARFVDVFEIHGAHGSKVTSLVEVGRQ